MAGQGKEKQLSSGAEPEQAHDRSGLYCGDPELDRRRRSLPLKISAEKEKKKEKPCAVDEEEDGRDRITFSF
jgi:hypothetical protein